MDISDNFIKNIEPEFYTGFPKLRFLIMRYNMLSLLSNELALMPSLQKLDILGNHFTSLTTNLGELKDCHIHMEWGLLAAKEKTMTDFLNMSRDAILGTGYKLDSERMYKHMRELRSKGENFYRFHNYLECLSRMC